MKKVVLSNQPRGVIEAKECKRGKIYILKTLNNYAILSTRQYEGNHAWLVLDETITHGNAYEPTTHTTVEQAISYQLEQSCREVFQFDTMQEAMAFVFNFTV